VLKPLTQALDLPGRMAVEQLTPSRPQDVSSLLAPISNSTDGPSTSHIPDRHLVNVVAQGVKLHDKSNVPFV